MLSYRDDIIFIFIEPTQFADVLLYKKVDQVTGFCQRNLIPKHNAIVSPSGLPPYSFQVFQQIFINLKWFDT
jgi:hypothetical protein